MASTANDVLKIGIEATLKNAKEIEQQLKSAIENQLVVFSDADMAKLAKRIATVQTLLDHGLFKDARKAAEGLNTYLLNVFNRIQEEAGGVSTDVAELLDKLNQAQKALAKLEKRSPDKVFRQTPEGDVKRRSALTPEETARVVAAAGGDGKLPNNWTARGAAAAIRERLNNEKLSPEQKQQLEEALRLLGYTLVDKQLELIKGIREQYEQEYKRLHDKLTSDVKTLSAEYKEASENAETITIHGDNNASFNANAVVLHPVAQSIKELSNATQEANKITEEESKVLRANEDALDKEAEAKDKNRQATEKQTSTVSKAVTTFFGYQMIIRQLRKLWNEATRTITELDKQLTNQAIVTDLTREETWKLVTTYQDLADQAGVTQTEIAAVTTEYLRQGETLDNALALTKAATAAATVAGISANDSVRYLTTAIHGFKLEAEDALAVSDKFAALAAQAATNYEDLAVALSKVASQAALAGMSMDYTLALLTTGLDVTQEAPESIGTALKTVIARMREISDYGKTLEDDVDLNQVESGLRAVGIQLRNGVGELRSTEDVLDELGRKWKDLSANQQAAVAKALAGTRQQSRLVAIMENYDDVLKNMTVSQNSLGATTAQQVKYLQGMEAATNRLQNAYQSLIETVVKSNEVIGVVNTLANILKQVKSFFSQSFGRVTFFASLLAILLKSRPLMDKIKNSMWEAVKHARDRLKTEQQITAELEKQNQEQKEQNLTAEEQAQEAFNKRFDKITNGISRGVMIAAAVSTVIGWIQEAVEVYKDRYKEASDNAIDKASEIQSEIYNNTQTMTNLQNLSTSLAKLDKQVIKSADTMKELTETRSQLLKELEISDEEGKLYKNQQLYDKAMAKRAQIENKNNELLSKLGDTLLGAANNYDAGAGVLNILTKVGAGAGLGAMALSGTGVGALAGAAIGAVIGGATAAFEEISKAMAANDAKGKVHEMLQNDEGVSQMRYYFKALYKNSIDTTTAAGEQLAASIKTTYASLIDSLSGAEIEKLLNEYNWDTNAMSTATTAILTNASEALTTLTSDTANYTERVQAAAELYTQLNAESEELGEAFLREYGSYVELGVILGDNVKYMDQFKWSMTAMNELLTQMAENNQTPEEMAEVIHALGEAMADGVLSTEELEAALGRLSPAAREAAAELISSFTMQDIADQFTSAKNNIAGIRDTQAKWGSMTPTERQRFIDDNEDFFNIPGAREAFYNGEDISEYLEIYKKTIQNDLIKIVNDKIAALQIDLYDLEKQYAEAEAAGNTAQMELLDKQIQTAKRSLEDLKDTYSDVNSMFNLTLSEVVNKQKEQISKLKEMYQAEEDALVNSLNKRKEAYQKYFDSLAAAESLEEYTQNREDLVTAIAKVGAGTDANSRRKMADLQRQLAELDKQEAQRKKEEARQAVLENIDTEISCIEERFDDLLKSDQALLDSMNENTYFQYLAYLAQSGQTKEAQELAIQQMGDLLKRKWSVNSNELFADTMVATPTVAETQVDSSSNTFTIINTAGEEQRIQLNSQQMRQLVAQMVDTVNRWTGTSYKAK